MSGLVEILRETTQMLRKEGSVTIEEGPVRVVHFYDMAHVTDARGRDDLELVDMHFVVVAVLRDEALRRREELNAALEAEYPDAERLTAGPSYIEIGANLGSQDAALRLMALGKVAGLWDVITPERFGMEGEQAERAAGNGFVLTSGWKREVTA